MILLSLSSTKGYMMTKYKETPFYSKVRLSINTYDLAKLLNITTKSVTTAIGRKQINLSSDDPWTNFWNLVSYLEKRGLRPNSNKEKI